MDPCRKALTRLVAVGAVFTAAAFVEPAVGASPIVVEPVELPPAVLYIGTLHAREWISPEVTRRLMHEVVDG